MLDFDPYINRERYIKLSFPEDVANAIRERACLEGITVRLLLIRMMEELLENS